MKSKDNEKKIKIALVCYSISGGGLERIIANYSFLFEDMGYNVHLHIVDSAIDYPVTGKSFFYNICEKTFFEKIISYFLLKKNLKQNKYDLIIDHRFRINPISEFFWQKFIYYNQNVINYIHSSKIENYLASKNKTLIKIIFSKKHLLTVSKTIEYKINKNLPFLRTRSIYNPIIVEKKLNPFDDLGNYLVTVARMDKSNVKQIDLLLECYAKSELPENNFKLIIIGSGPSKETMVQLASTLKIEKKVFFTGFLENPYAFIRNAFFTALTSKHEGLPTVLIESLMLGTPVVSFDCETGPNEIIIHEQNGILVENQNKDAFINAMNRMINEPELYTKLKSNAIKSVEKFSIECIKLEWKNFIENVLIDKY